MINGKHVMISSTTKSFEKPGFDILDVIDLLHADSDLNGLYERLKKIKKEVFAPEEKIVILHFDSEYYYQGCPLGFQTHNLFSIWRSLDIPYSVMMLIHNQHGIERGIEHFIVCANDSPTLINVLVNRTSISHLKHWIANPPIPKNIEYFAACLMQGTPRAHRVALMQYLTKHNLLDLVRTNFRIFSGNHCLSSNSVTEIQLSLSGHTALNNTVYSWPHRINEDVFCQSRIPEIAEFLSTPVVNRRDPVLTGNFDQFYHKFFLDIVTETQFHSPNIMISEKTLRPLLTMSPFLTFATAGTLAHLRDHGFQTFGEFWDESYDNEQDPHLRFLACCRIIRQLSTMPLQVMKKIHEQMLPVLVHNRNTLINYINKQYQPLATALSL